MAGYDVRRARCGGTQQLEAFHHLPDVQGRRERPLGLQMFVIMSDIRGDDHPAAGGMHAQELQTRRMAGRGMQLKSRHQFVTAVVQPDPARVVEAYDSDHVFHFERVGEMPVAHVTADRVMQLRLLEVELGGREAMEVADMIVMQVR
jgi:hypothetical protein